MQEYRCIARLHLIKSEVKSSTEYQNWIYRVSADILRVSQSCWRNMRYFFRSPTIIAGYIYKFASEVIAADQRKPVQPAVVMYFIRILFGINNCLGKGEAIFSCVREVREDISHGRLKYEISQLCLHLSLRQRAKLLSNVCLVRFEMSREVNY